MTKQKQTLHYIIYGAGGVGGVIGARLLQAGYPVTLIARGEHADHMRRQGLHFLAPGEDVTLPVRVVSHPRELAFNADDVVLLCMKSQHTLQALEDLVAMGARDIPIVCVQNGVANEALALRFFPRVYATVVNLPAFFIHPGEVATQAAGRGGVLDTGCYPLGVDAMASAIADDFSTAGFSAFAAGDVMRQKYAKLLLNLYNVLQAGLSDFAASSSIRRLIRTEALACYQAAGIDCANKAETELRNQGLFTLEDIPGYERMPGSSWQSLFRGTGDIETEYLNGEISRLGRCHGVATPANDACVHLARSLVRAGQGPGLITAAEFEENIRRHKG